MASSRFNPRQIQSHVLWRVGLFANRQRVPATWPYEFDNRRRKYSADVVCQYTFQGSIVFRDNQGEHVCKPGSLLLFNYDEDTSYGRVDNRTYVCRWINLRGPGLPEQWRAMRDRFGSVVHLGSDKLVPMEMQQLMSRADAKHPTSPLEMAAAVQHFVLLLLRVLHEQDWAQQTPVQRAVDEILQRPTWPGSLKEIADRFSCSREHLSRVFQQQVGVSPGEYIAQARVRAAIDMIKQMQMPLSDIARQTGLGTAHTLIRRVREATGKTPGELRQA